MKVGAQDRNKLYIAIGLFAVGIFLFIRMLAGNSSPAAASAPVPAASTSIVAAPSASRPVTRTARGKGRATKQPVSAGPTLDPRLQLALLAESENTEYTGKGRNIFRADELAEIPQPVAPAIKKAQIAPPAPVVPQGPPPPPPINLKFFGFANPTGSPDKKIFLSQGDDVFVASEGDIVNRRYKIIRISPNSVEIEDVLSNNRQTIPLTAGAAGG